MADPTLSTTVSRRSMLAGGVAVMAAPVPVFAALPVAEPPPPEGQRPDAVLLRRIAAAHDCLADYHRADALCLRLQRSLSDHPDFPHDGMPRTPEEGERWDALMARTGIAAADARCERLYERYEAALAVAFAMPARTVAGVHGKLRLAVTAVKQEQSTVLDPADCAYLDSTLGDLWRLAAGCADAGSPSPLGAQRGKKRFFVDDRASEALCRSVCASGALASMDADRRWREACQGRRHAKRGGPPAQP